MTKDYVMSQDPSGRLVGPPADVEVKVPADGAFVSVLRTTTAGLAARLDFTIDEIEDLRIAVGEASALVLLDAAEGSDLWCRIFLGEGAITVTTTVAVDHPVVPDYESFTWMVLATLASEATVDVVDDAYTVTLTLVSSLAGANS